MATYQHRDPNTLTSHPLNAEIFRDTADEALIESVWRLKEVISPLIVTGDGLILAGERRKQAAIICGLESVPVIVRDDLTDKHDQDAAWYDTNLNREMTTEQRARWFKAREAFYAAELKDNQRQSQGRGKRCTKSGTPIEAGKASDKAAAETGLKRETARKAAAVVDAIDAAEDAGDTATAEDLRDKLNGSVDKAHKAVKGNGAAAPEREPWRVARSKAKKTAEALMRAIEDLNELRTLRWTEEGVDSCRRIINKLDALK